MTEEPKPSRYLQYLPAIFHRPPEEEGEIDLGQFLLPFDNALAGFESVLAVIDHYIAAGLTPDKFMRWLASWARSTANWPNGIRPRPALRCRTRKKRMPASSSMAWSGWRARSEAWAGRCRKTRCDTASGETERRNQHASCFARSRSRWPSSWANSSGKQPRRWFVPAPH